MAFETYQQSKVMSDATITNDSNQQMFSSFTESPKEEDLNRPVPPRRIVIKVERHLSR